MQSGKVQRLVQPQRAERPPVSKRWEQGWPPVHNHRWGEPSASQPRWSWPLRSRWGLCRINPFVQKRLKTTSNFSNLPKTSVADPNPDPHVFGPPGSGFISQRYGSGSGSIYHQAEIVSKILILLFCDFFDFLSLKKIKYLQKLICRNVRHVTGNDQDYLRKIPRVVVQKSALL
jgi:hypothetical protein